MLKTYKKSIYIYSLRVKNSDMNKIAEKYTYYWHLEQKPTAHLLYTSDLNNVKGKKQEAKKRTLTITNINKRP